MAAISSIIFAMLGAFLAHFLVRMRRIHLSNLLSLFKCIFITLEVLSGPSCLTGILASNTALYSNGICLGPWLKDMGGGGLYDFSSGSQIFRFGTRSAVLEGTIVTLRRL